MVKKTKLKTKIGRKLKRTGQIRCRKLADYRHGLFVSTFLLGASLLLMTVGFAAYDRLLSLNGAVVITDPEGKIRISNVTVEDTVNATAVPSWTDTTIDFGLAFNKPEGTRSSQRRAKAVYAVTIHNGTFSDKAIKLLSFVPSVSSTTGACPLGAPPTYTFIGLTDGETLLAGADKTFQIEINYQFGRKRSADTHVMAGDMTFEYPDADTGSITADLIGERTGDLRGDLEYATFTVRITNTYPYPHAVTLALDNARFVLSAEAGAMLEAVSVPGRDHVDLTVYVSKAPYAQFISDHETAGLSGTADAGDTLDLGRITLLVDQNAQSYDLDPPQISAVTATVSTTAGQIDVHWQATDEGPIDHFVLLLYKTDGDAPSQTLTTADDSLTASLTDIAEDGEYYVKVYGVDVHGNRATDAQIASATTATGACSRSNAVTGDWFYPVTLTLTGINPTQPQQAPKGGTYEAVFTPDFSSPPRNSRRKYIFPPRSITVTMNGRELTAGTDYTYTHDDSEGGSGHLTIPNVDGPIEITASARTGRPSN